MQNLESDILMKATQFFETKMALACVVLAAASSGAWAQTLPAAGSVTCTAIIGNLDCTTTGELKNRDGKWTVKITNPHTVPVSGKYTYISSSGQSSFTYTVKANRSGYYYVDEPQTPVGLIINLKLEKPSNRRMVGKLYNYYVW